MAQGIQMSGGANRADHASCPVFLDYDLPPELIAQFPPSQREQARLLVVDRAREEISHKSISDLPFLLRPHDLLILNNTRVLPARLEGVREDTGGAWEGLYLRSTQAGHWEMLCQTRGRLREGTRIAIADGALVLELMEKTPTGTWLATPQPNEPALALLHRHGTMPLPRYIRKGLANPCDRDRYQTVFAECPGAVAAPTAGLHFTPQLLSQLSEHGISNACVTLHVGAGTFRPLPEGDYRDHRLHGEMGEIRSETVDAIRKSKSNGGRTVAVGTTSTRVLETASEGGELHPWQGETSLYVYPPYRFRAVDALLTNFHLPKTSLLLLVDAFAGSDLVRRAYEEAIAHRYRFYSYGDAMLIV